MCCLDDKGSPLATDGVAIGKSCSSNANEMGHQAAGTLEGPCRQNNEQEIIAVFMPSNGPAVIVEVGNEQLRIPLERLLMNNQGTVIVVDRQSGVGVA